MRGRSRSWKVLVPGAALFLFPFLAAPGFAQCTITVTSDRPLPAPNMAINPGFESGLQPWQTSGLVPGDGVTIKEAHSGTHSFKIAGQKGVNKEIHQGRVGPQQFVPPIPKGTLVTTSGWCKTKGTSYTGGSCCLSAVVTYAGDTTGSYLTSPDFPKVEHDWMCVTATDTLKKDTDRIDWFYGAMYYDQEGEAYFDDVYIALGTVKVAYKVAGPNLKSVKLYSEEKGLLNSSGPLAAGTAIYDGNAEVGPLDRVCVEVADAAGKITREFYPKLTAPPPAPTANEIPLFTRFDPEHIAPVKSESYPLTMPALDPKKTVLLELRARAQYRSLAGCSGIMEISINGKPVTGDRLFGRKTRLTFASGQDCPVVQGAATFYGYYSPDFGPISPENDYYPQDVPNNDPYLFRLKVSDLVHAGENTVVITNVYPAGKDAATLVVGGARLLITDNK